MHVLQLSRGVKEVVSWKDFEWFGHHKLFRIIRFEAKIINDEPLRVGAGKATSTFEPVDLTVVKIFNPKINKYVPFIPGSSWKGVFRAHAVRIAKSHGLDKVCEGVPQSTCLTGNEFHEYERKGIDEKTKIELIMQGSIRSCLLCLVFGTPSILSHIVFHDSMPIEEPILGYRTMVAISRRTGAASPRALYAVEYIEPGSRFTFTMEAINLPNYVIGLLMTIIEHLNLGLVKVGGMKTRGFGKIHFEDIKLNVLAIHKEYGIVDGVLRALDPIDKDVKWGEVPILQGEEAKKAMGEFIQIWKDTIPQLKKVNDNEWRWSIIGE